MTALVITLALFLVAWFLTEYARRALARRALARRRKSREQDRQDLQNWLDDLNARWKELCIVDLELLDLFHSCERGDRPPGGTYSAFGSLTAPPEDEEGDRAEQDS